MLQRLILIFIYFFKECEIDFKTTLSATPLTCTLHDTVAGRWPLWINAI